MGNIGLLWDVGCASERVPTRAARRSAMHVILVIGRNIFGRLCDRVESYVTRLGAKESAVKHSAVQDSAVQDSSGPCRTVQDNTVQDSAG